MHRNTGIDVLFRQVRKLVCDKTIKSRLGVVRVTESQFADNSSSVIPVLVVHLKVAARKFVEVAKNWEIKCMLVLRRQRKSERGIVT